MKSEINFDHQGALFSVADWFIGHFVAVLRALSAQYNRKTSTFSNTNEHRCLSWRHQNGATIDEMNTAIKGATPTSRFYPHLKSRPPIVVRIVVHLFKCVQRCYSHSLCCYLYSEIEFFVGFHNVTCLKMHVWTNFVPTVCIRSCQTTIERANTLKTNSFKR